MFKEQLFSRIQLLEIVQYTLLAVGLAAFASCLLAVCILRCKDRKMAA